MTDRKGLGMTGSEMNKLTVATMQVEALRKQLADAQATVEALQAQLPAEMQGCTILFKECEKGHGRLVATNWRDHGCQTCEVEALQRERDEAHEQLVTERGRHQELERELLARAAQVNRDTQAAIEAERERVPFLEKKIHNLIAASDIVLKVKADQDVRIAKLQAALDAAREKVAELEAAANYYKQPSKNGGVYSVSGGHIGNLMDWCKDNLKHCKFSGPDEDNLDLDLVQTAQQIPQLKTELSQLQALVRALVDKLDESDKASQGIFITAAMHGIHYNGPSYADELQALKATLDATTPATTKT